MKSKLLIGIIAFFVACLLLLICGFGRNLIAPWKVMKIELSVYDAVGTRVGTAELTSADVSKFIMCYNLSRYAGEKQADRCDRDFYVCIILEDGRQISITDAGNHRITVTGLGDEDFWADNALLFTLIKNLDSRYFKAG